MKNFLQFELNHLQSKNTLGKGNETIQMEEPRIPEIAGPCPPGEEEIAAETTILGKGRNKKA